MKLNLGFNLFNIVRLIKLYGRTGIDNIVKGKGCKIHPTVMFSNPKRIVLGNNVTIGEYSTIQAGMGKSLFIGHNTIIAPNVRILGDDHKYNKKTVKSSGLESEDMEIGKDCWIGTNSVIILASLGDGCVVGANTIITKCFGNNVVIVGVNRVLKRRC